MTHAYLFGSAARDEASAESDVDMMIDLDEGPNGRKPLFSAFDVGGIQYELARILGRRVDLVVRKDALKPGKRLKAVAEGQLVDIF
ncbi:MAG: nucleotidyltransferase family protein [Sphingomonadales bacterium]